MKTNLKRTTRNWRITKAIFLITTIFWALETIYFLIKYGWHFRAINEYEKFCDNLCSIGFAFCLGFMLSVSYDIINYLLSEEQ